MKYKSDSSKRTRKTHHPQFFWNFYPNIKKFSPEIRIFSVQNDHSGSKMTQINQKSTKFWPKKWIFGSRWALISILSAKTDSTQKNNRGKWYLLDMSHYIKDTRAVQSFLKSTFSKNHKSQRLSFYGTDGGLFCIYKGYTKNFNRNSKIGSWSQLTLIVCLLPLLTSDMHVTAA